VVLVYVAQECFKAKLACFIPHVTSMNFAHRRSNFNITSGASVITLLVRSHNDHFLSVIDSPTALTSHHLLLTSIPYNTVTSGEKTYHGSSCKSNYLFSFFLPIAMNRIKSVGRDP